MVKHQIDEQLIGYLYVFHSIRFVSFRFRNDSDDCDGVFGGIVLTVATVATVALGLICCVGQRHTSAGVLGFVLITDTVFVHQPAALDVQILCQGICRHPGIESFCKL